MEIMSAQECQNASGGELITLTTVMAIVVIAVMAVVVYRLFMSEEGSTTIPGGFKFTWK